MESLTRVTFILHEQIIVTGGGENETLGEIWKTVQNKFPTFCPKQFSEANSHKMYGRSRVLRTVESKSYNFYVY